MPSIVKGQLIHCIHADEWQVMVTTGSQDGLAKVVGLLVDEGDNVLTENPTYR